jgi:hypothetical protein
LAAAAHNSKVRLMFACKPTGLRLSLALPIFAAVWLCLAGGDFAFGWPGGGEFKLSVLDPETGQPLPCRMHITNEKGKPQRASKVPFWHDHFAFPGTVKIKLPKGTYQFTVERGPEYQLRSGYFIIENLSKDEKVFDLKRAINMSDKGWWSGDLHIHRPVKDIELLMLAEDLHVAPLVSWTNSKSEWSKREPPEDHVEQFDKNRYYDLLAGEDQRAGGDLLFFRLPKPLDFAGATRDFPPSLRFALAAREQPDAWVDAAEPFSWDLPLWLAAGQVDSIGLCNDHLRRSSMGTKEGDGKPHDRKRLPDPLGIGQWSQEIYYHVLNCGLRIPPSAGSGSGEAPNPLGYNRVYVWVDKERFNYETWWEGFKLGRVVVTNGPLLEPLANDRQPGHVFQVPEGESFTAEVMTNFTTREDKISYFELVKDGRVAQSVRFEDFVRTGRFAPLDFDESGWFLVRAVTDNEATYRFASSGAWYVEFAEAPKRISKLSAQFFLDWVEERAAQIKLEDAEELRETLKFVEQAKQFWQNLVEQANAD